jgi:hypothetical protein
LRKEEKVSTKPTKMPFQHTETRGCRPSPETLAVMAQARATGRNIFKIHADGNNYTRMMGVIRKIVKGERELSEYSEDWIKLRGQRPKSRNDFSDALNERVAAVKYLKPGYSPAKPYVPLGKKQPVMDWMESNAGYVIYKQVYYKKVSSMTPEERHQTRGYNRARRARNLIDSGDYSLTDFAEDYTLRGLHLKDTDTQLSVKKRRKHGAKKRWNGNLGMLHAKQAQDRGVLLIRKKLILRKETLPEVPSWCLERYEPRWKLQLQETPQHLIFG